MYHNWQFLQIHIKQTVFESVLRWTLDKLRALSNRRCSCNLLIDHPLIQSLSMTWSALWSVWSCRQRQWVVRQRRKVILYRRLSMTSFTWLTGCNSERHRWPVKTKTWQLLTLPASKPLSNKPMSVIGNWWPSKMEPVGWHHARPVASSDSPGLPD